MAGQNLQTEDMCIMDEKIPVALKNLQYRKEKTRAAILLKIDAKKNLIVIDDTYEDCTTEELQEELPDCQPRFVVYSYTHKTRDGRTSYPLLFIYYLPSGCSAQLLMRYVGSVNKVFGMSGAQKCLEMSDKSNLTDEWLVKKQHLT